MDNRESEQKHHDLNFTNFTNPIWLIFGIIIIIAGIAFFVIYQTVVRHWFMLAIAIGLVVLGGSFCYYFYHAKRKARLLSCGIDSMAVLTEVTVSTQILLLSYTYTDTNGWTRTGAKGFSKVHPTDIGFVKALQHIPIRFHGGYSELREDELVAMVDELRNKIVITSNWTSTPLVSNICPHCNGKIEFENADKGTCMYCGTVFMR